eukprot:8938965-Lingulodinium_polyedra.AAC.1
MVIVSPPADCSPAFDYVSVCDRVLWLLKKAMYGLKSALPPRPVHFGSGVESLGFVSMESDLCLFEH